MAWMIIPLMHLSNVEEPLLAFESSKIYHLHDKKKDTVGVNLEKKTNTLSHISTESQM